METNLLFVTGDQLLSCLPRFATPWTAAYQSPPVHGIFQARVLQCGCHCLLQRRERLPTPVFWPGESHGLYSPQGGKELDTTERLSLSLPECGPPCDGMIPVVRSQMSTCLIFALSLSGKVGLFRSRAIF